MEDQINWNSNFEFKNPTVHFKFTCFRCNTKNTHAEIFAIINANEIKVPTELYNKENFIILKCSTCGAFTILYNYYEGQSWTDLGGTAESPSTKNRRIEFREPKASYFPVNISIKDIPEIVKEDYKLMFGCKLIGSNQGVAVHYRRILDKIFSEYEKAFLSEEERKDLKRINERAKQISEKNKYFQAFNETIIDLKGIVSTIVHQDLDNLEIATELNISQEDFEQLDRIILSLLKMYELEFKDLPAIKLKSQKISELKKD